MKRMRVLLIISTAFLIAFSLSFIRNKKPEKKKFFREGRKIGIVSKGVPLIYESTPYKEDEILVKFKPSITSEQIQIKIASYETEIKHIIPEIKIYQLKLPEGYTVEEMIQVYNENPDVEFAEPNYVAYGATIPNDPYFYMQYALHNTGQVFAPRYGIKGKHGADINAPEAWNKEVGEESIVIAIVDSGIDYNHPDLKDKVISKGRDFVNGDYDAMDDFIHGTFVAGIAAADTNNSLGIAGVSWKSKLLPVKVLDKENKGYWSWIAEGTIWAANQGAKVINLSIAGEFSRTMEEAINYVYNKGCVVVAAAGNKGKAVSYPAAFDKVLAVAATNYNDERVSFSNTEGTWASNYGPEIDVAAPGFLVLGCVPVWWANQKGWTRPYGYWSGTSLAAPHVAGMAALILSHKPWLTNSQVMDIIRLCTDDVNKNVHPGKDNFLGYGRINMEKAFKIFRKQ